MLPALIEMLAASVSPVTERPTMLNQINNFDLRNFFDLETGTSSSPS